MAVMKEGEDRLMPDQFCYWFHGFTELNGEVPTKEQWNIIKHHLELVFRPLAHGEKLRHPSEPKSIPQSLIDAVVKGVELRERRNRWPGARFETERIC